MPERRPSNVEEHNRWLLDVHHVEAATLSLPHYLSFSRQAKDAFEQSDAWRTLARRLSEFEQSYLITTKYPLLLLDILPPLKTKPYDSFTEKVFRTNVVGNRRFPQQPPQGWILPENWFERINDVLRTMLVVKYLDGVAFLSDRLREHFEAYGWTCEISFQAREEGYYAAHVYAYRDIAIPPFPTVKMPIEIQITTQLQEVIRTLTHRYYETRRLNPPQRGDPKWQWNYEADEFVANYLGHILHYVEGMIMDVRKRQREAG